MQLTFGRVKLKYVRLVVLTACVFLLTGCSRALLFVVTNRSAGSIEVRYKMKKSPAGVLLACDAPGTMMASQLGTNQPWRVLSDSEYQLDQVNHQLTVSLKAQETLRITVTNYPSNEADEITEARRFCIEEIEVTGDRGAVKFVGEEAYYGFVAETSMLRSLTYK